MKRTIRRILEIALPVSGMGIIFLSVLFGSDSLQIQVLFVLFGILILEAGVWGLASRLLPDERRYLDLREEVDHFIGLIPELNASAVASLDYEESKEDEQRFQEVLEQLHACVARMGEVAANDRKAAEAADTDTASEAPDTDTASEATEASDADTPGEQAALGLDAAQPLP